MTTIPKKKKTVITSFQSSTRSRDVVQFVVYIQIWNVSTTQ